MADPSRQGGADAGPSQHRLPVDRLLTELNERLDEIILSRERQQSLLDAVITIGSDLELPAILDRILAAACTLVDARYGALGVLDDTGGLVDFRTTGLSDEEVAAIGPPPVGDGLLGLLFEQPHSLRVDDVAGHPASSGVPDRHPSMRTFLGLPIMIADKVWGNLYLTEKRGGGTFTADDENVVKALAAAAGIAVDNARLYAELEESQLEREQMLLFHDRDRIGRDLHDMVIQRLFATGLQLQSVIGLISAPEATARVVRAVEEIDGAIANLRAAIFNLHTDEEVRLSATVRSLVSVIRDQLGFTPELIFEGPVDTAVAEAVRIEVLAMLRETLSNIAQHSRAEHVTVWMTATEDRLTVTVGDNGQGIPSSAPRRGLANLAARAQTLGGTFDVVDREAGTELRWSVPLG